MRTYNRADWVAAQGAWRDYGPEWHFYQQLAADRGFIYPPSGTRWGDIDDPAPSQRAIIWRAISDTPEALTNILRQSRSWSDVVRKLMADVDRRREDADIAERQDEWDRQDEPKPRQALQSIYDIFQRIKDSAS